MTLFWYLSLSLSLVTGNGYSGSTIPSTSIFPACSDTIHVTLDENCEALITPTLVGKSLATESLEDYRVLIQKEGSSFSSEGLLSGCGYYKYLLVAPQGDTCWGIIKAFDASAPRFLPPDGYETLEQIQDIYQTNYGEELLCTQLPFLLNNPYPGFPTPIAFDNCQPVAPLFYDSVLASGCKGVELLRTWRLKEETCFPKEARQTIFRQRIHVRQPNASDVQWPEDKIVVRTCLRDTSPQTTGYPSIGQIPLAGVYPMDTCGLHITYKDHDFITICGGSYHFFRTWTLYDWCAETGAQITTYRQRIEVQDNQAPLLECPGKEDEPLVFGISAFSCEAILQIPAPVVNDRCSDIKRIQVYILQRKQIPVVDTFGDTLRFQNVRDTLSGPWNVGDRVSQIPLGEYTFLYEAEDDCGNIRRLRCDFLVEDLLEPIAVCKNKLHLTLDNTGQGRLTPQQVNEGSWDNCGIEVYEIGFIYDDPTSPYFDPESVGWQQEIQVNCGSLYVQTYIGLRVTDTTGNTNTCWQELLVEDKMPPRCIPPPDTVVYCHELPADFWNTNDTLIRITYLQELFGEATVKDNCDNSTILEYFTFEPGQCNTTGIITRIFTALSYNGDTSTCYQTIDIRSKHHYRVIFPADLSFSCIDGEANGSLFEPDTTLQIETFGPCDLLVQSVQEQRFEGGVGCFGIERTYRVMNWCEYDGQSAPFILPRSVTSNVYLDVYDGVASTSLGGVPSTGFWQYTQRISIIDQTAPVILMPDTLQACANTADCSGSVTVTIRLQDECFDRFRNRHIDVLVDENNDLVVDKSFEKYGGKITRINNRRFEASLSLSVGLHRLIVIAKDDCNEATRKEIWIVVKDCKAPAPICTGVLTVSLSPGKTDVDGDGIVDAGVATVWAGDFLASSTTDCSGILGYAIYRKEEVVQLQQQNELWRPDTSRQSLVLTCKDFFITPVYVYAIDKAGLSDYCEVLLHINGFERQCAENASTIAGGIFTEHFEPVPNIDVSVNGTIPRRVKTTEDGLFRFDHLANGYNYTIVPKPAKSMDKAGISTLDIVLTTKHILGVKSLDSPYKILAADVNQSGTVSTLDIIAMRKLILGINEGFTGQSPWMFVQASYRFTDTQHPETLNLPQKISINNLNTSVINAYFIAIKMGDVNGSVMRDGY